MTTSTKTEVANSELAERWIQATAKYSDALVEISRCKRDFEAANPRPQAGDIIRLYLRNCCEECQPYGHDGCVEYVVGNRVFVRITGPIDDFDIPESIVIECGLHPKQLGQDQVEWTAIADRMSIDAEIQRDVDFT